MTAGLSSDRRAGVEARPETNTACGQTLTLALADQMIRQWIW
jgi:hypothetical protein